jgi:hypothetical protein
MPPRSSFSNTSDISQSIFQKVCIPPRSFATRRLGGSCICMYRQLFRLWLFLCPCLRGLRPPILLTSANRSSKKFAFLRAPLRLSGSAVPAFPFIRQLFRLWLFVCMPPWSSSSNRSDISQSIFQKFCISLRSFAPQRLRGSCISIYPTALSIVVIRVHASVVFVLQ